MTENISIDTEKEEYELDRALDVLLAEKRLWEEAFSAAQNEIKEKSEQIAALTLKLQENSLAYSYRESKTDEFTVEDNIKMLTFPANKRDNIPSNTVAINMNTSNKSEFENYALRELIKIGKNQIDSADGTCKIISMVETSQSIEAAYAIIWKLLAESNTEKLMLERLIESLKSELNTAQEAVQLLHKKIQDTENNHHLVSIAYSSQMKSIQNDLSSACKDIEFWKNQYETLAADKLNKNTLSQLTSQFEEFNTEEWCDLSCGANTSYSVEITPNSFWWFIAL
ncbi:uncharacterized protein CMU_035720 [Cryptosporidium muris RN66]|uniref:Uncharacterized protein n=1 Tax=Cryptosporidium muris (strain RN66) TaxID=441375 RepID=B6AGQ8_CRYMR|nr:uncharacterized protein CMU_035720 [Cryptosporidium muris RN66]EEA07399.1 hypothetical protein, conserved [Cryptosporidium muris RN66]|eukprot:XP_002141748.1 hypothetical protein [Cryptosporidium muris RN66]